MEGRKSRFLLLSLVVLAVFVTSASARVYVPQEVDEYYPEIVFRDKSSGNAQWDALGQPNSNEPRPAKRLGPLGDFDGDGKQRIPIRANNGPPYIKANERTTSNFIGLDDENPNDKPKSGKILSTGLIDGDLKTDVLFVNQNGNLAHIDSDSYGSFSQSAGSPVGTGDVDRDGYEEIAFTDTSAGLKYLNFEQGDTDPNPQTFGSVSLNSKKGVSTPLHLGDGDGRLEVAYQTGSSYLKAKDVDTSETGRLDDGLGNIKKFSIGVLWLGDGDGKPEMAVAGNSNEMYLCSFDTSNGDCQQTGNDNGFSISKKKTKGTRSYIPPFVQEPKLSSNVITQGQSLTVTFNATDWEGYTDIVNPTAQAKFEGPQGALYTKSDPQVSITEFTKESSVSGTSKPGGYVPDDGKTKAFNATFSVPENANPGTWNATVQVKDEKMTGTLNFSTFQVEKALIEKNVTQNISMGRKDTSRQTSLGKSQITGLSYASAGLSNSFTKRLLTESLGFSPGRDRKQRLKKGVSSSVGVSRSALNFKASFPVFSSVFSAGSVISDVYATETSLRDFLSISDTTSDEALFTGAVQDSLDLQTSQGKGIAQALLKLALGVSSEEGRSVGLNRSSQEALSLGSSESPALSFGRVFVDNLVLAPQNRVQQDVLRLFSESVGVDLLGARDQSIQRSDNNTITGSSSFSRASDTTRLILEAFSQDSTFSRFDFSATRLLSQSFSTSGRFGEPLATGLVNIALGVDQSFDRSSTVLGRTLLSDFLASGSPIGQLTSVRGTNQTLAAGNRIGATGLFFGSSTQNLGVGQSIGSLPNFIVSVTQILQSDGSQSSSILLQRSSDLNLNLSNSNSRNIFVLRSFSSGLSPSFAPSVFDGAIAVVQQLIGLSSGETDTLVSPRTQDTGIGVSSGISERQTVFRSFTQSVIASTAPSFLEGFIDDLVNGVVCRIFGQDSTFCDIPEGSEDSSPSDDSDDGGGGGGIGNIGGQNRTQALDNGTESPSNTTQDKDIASGENVSLSDINRSSSISVNVSLKSENDSKASVQLENVSSGKSVSLNLQERPRDDSQTSKPSQDLENTEDEPVKLDSISFEVEEGSKDSAINVTTVENSSKLNITSENKIYKTTEVSTDVKTDKAELIYNVQKSFLSQNNATKNELVVNRWKNSSRIQTLPTELINESASNLTVKAVSPNGFSIFTIGLKNTASNASVTSREFNFEYTFPNIQLVKLFKAILILSSLYFIRYPLLKTLFTLDIKLSYTIEKVHVRVLELRRRLRWWLDAGEGREEFSLADDVNSLRNRKETLQFKKKKLQKEVERKKELRNRHSMRLELLANKVEKWREKLDV